MTAAIRLSVAEEKIAEMSSKRLKALDGDSDELWQLGRRVNVPFFKLRVLIRRERFRRGDLKMGDLHPEERREMIEHFGATDLHGIANGPIMDAAQIYLPAGKLSMAETRAREAAQWSKA